MNTQASQLNSSSSLALKTNIFNDNVIVGNSLQIGLSDDACTIDISDKLNANFTDSDWDRILDNILLSSKVITV